MKGRGPRNNNGSSIRQLAWKSIKSSGMRNVFVILTIVLSVSLLMVIALFYAGMNTAEKRQTEHMQHAIYSGLTLKQLSGMAEDEKSAFHHERIGESAFGRAGAVSRRADRRGGKEIKRAL